jgi:hypothetical protein
MASYRTHDGLYPAAHASARLAVPVQTRLVSPTNAKMAFRDTRSHATPRCTARPGLTQGTGQPGRRPPRLPPNLRHSLPLPARTPLRPRPVPSRARPGAGRDLLLTTGTLRHTARPVSRRTFATPSRLGPLRPDTGLGRYPSHPAPHHVAVNGPARLYKLRPLDYYGDPSTPAGFNCDMASAPRCSAWPRSAAACVTFLFYSNALPMMLHAELAAFPTTATYIAIAWATDIKPDRRLKPHAEHTALTTAATLDITTVTPVASGYQTLFTLTWSQLFDPISAAIPGPTPAARPL